MRLKIITPLLIALAISTFTACSSSGSSEDTTDLDTVTYTINATENKDIPLDAKIVSASTQQAQVKITRDVEADNMNVYVISGSVEITEVVAE